jgi:hypothetical protein
MLLRAFLAAAIGTVFMNLSSETEMAWRHRPATHRPSCLGTGHFAKTMRAHRLANSSPRRHEEGGLFWQPLARTIPKTGARSSVWA